jgi:cytochrome P450
MQKQMDTRVTDDVATCPFDHHSAELRGEAKYVTYEDLRERRVQRSDAWGGFWILTHADDVEKALLDNETYSSQRGGVMLPPSPSEFPFAALEHDPPEHTPYRRLYMKAVGKPAVRAAEEPVRALAARVLTGFIAAGGGDFVTEVGSVLPVETIALVIGLPEEKATRIRELTHYAWTHIATDPKCFEPLINMYMGEIMARRAHPTDDFLSLIANTRDLGDRPMTDVDLIGVVNGLLIAGHETTMNASGNLALALARDPALRARIVADPSIIPAVVEESLRFDSPVQNFLRMLTRDVEVDGVTMHEGDRVMLVYGSANRDPDAYPDPDTFDADRNAPKHFSFGWGLHRCVGAPLAQLELQTLCGLLAPHDFSVVGEPEYAPPSGNGPFAGLAHLQLAFH